MDDHIDDHIDNDIERDFWHDEPTRRLGRTPVRPAVRNAQRDITGSVQRTRQHVAVVATPEPRRRRHADPLIIRLAVIVGLGVAMVPVALTLRHGADEVLRTASAAPMPTVPVGEPLAAAITVEITDAQVLVDPTQPPAPIQIASTTTEFDIDALPQAVPVKTQAPTTAVPATTSPVGRAGTSTPATTEPATTAPATTTTAVQPALAEAPVAKAVCSKSYQVASGDYWILIAGKVDVTVTQLLAANNATAATPLYPGRTICLPKGAATAGTAATVTTPAPKTSTVDPAVTTAAPTTTVPARVYSAGEVEAIIRDVWPDELEDEAIRIARRESNLRPAARNACCYGLFQIYYTVHKGWLGAIGITSAQQLFDPRSNATAGYTLYQRSGGWGPWAV
jgi:LysM repeat protein